MNVIVLKSVTLSLALFCVMSTPLRELKSPTVFLKKSKSRPSTGMEIHTACFHMWHFYVLCWVIVLDWTVKYYVGGWVVIFITVLVFYHHYLLLLIHRMSCMHL